MASRRSKTAAGPPQVPGSGVCSAPSSCGTQVCCEDPHQGSGLAKAPALVEGPGSRLPRNVLSERERRWGPRGGGGAGRGGQCARNLVSGGWDRLVVFVLAMARGRLLDSLQLGRLLLPGSRKRISVSCERLRALLPRFDGRREDMASVLEMSVQFLRLAGTLVPGWEQHAETRHKWQKDVLQLALATQTPAGAPDPGRGAPSVTMPQTPPSCVAAGVDEGVAKVPDRLPVLSEPPSLVPGSRGPSPSKAPRKSPLWPPHSRQPPSPLVSEEPLSCLGQAGPSARGTHLAPTLDARSVSGCDVEDGASFLLTASPDWWPGSLEGRGGSAPSQVPTRSSPLGRAEPGFLADPEPGSQEPPDGPLEPWGSDVSCPSLALRDEVESIFPDFFAC
ncbi:Spermatogenesis- and oogenesis-specific basic helix-loop-helix-containing protein 1 [Camelus dromedarius]|uniref:Spermatogenesis-and oogenesis-specific basic helix-loop-helix-containing protein 1 n=1 Tax=Camelus dromedarius TaxID=9838 RepID=A0A5N4EAJ6_CAMDR|nr:Spermatogenesis- and oogenesis-specific basic helix-loop-helix-containing protein 1 [Camelus dromedarius]